MVHQRIVPEAFRHLGATRLAHQLDVVDVGAAVGPVEGARQRAVAIGLIEEEGVFTEPVIQTLVGGLQMGTLDRPVVQGDLQGGGDLRDFHRVAQVAGDHDQHAITALIQRCEFHRQSSVSQHVM